MTSPTGHPSMGRRALLKAVAAFGLHTAANPAVFGRRADAQPLDRPALTGYLESLSRPDGGYAWEGQDASHLTPTFAVVGCYRLLGRMPPDPRAVAGFLR